ncbi:DoxX family protein [Brevibacterium sp. S111]|uniref:DoxX family protein n=1 Tax=Brevibacterium sp. S111 TaxID=2483795 RepID=UPI00196B9797|nr:DoxX family protein [Brevibacterium sp. S111]
MTKFVAVAALIAGIWVPYLALLAPLGVVGYFVSAIGMHIRAQDFGQNLFLNATGMLALSIGPLVLDFVRISSV